MFGSHLLRRRRFLQVAAATGPLLSSCGRGKSSWRFFSEDEAATLNAVCEQIIPADQDPGAAWAGAVNFIDIQLTRHYRKYQKAYRDGLAAVNKAALDAQGKVFAGLDWDRQTAVLKALEKAKDPFIALVVAHTMQSFYGDPRHGGNRDHVSGKMLGVPFPPVRGRNRYGEA